MTQNLFKWQHFQTEFILLCLRWYLKYPVSYRMLDEIMHMIRKGQIDIKSQCVLSEIKFIQKAVRKN